MHKPVALISTPPPVQWRITMRSDPAITTQAEIDWTATQSVTVVDYFCFLGHIFSRQTQYR